MQSASFLPKPDWSLEQWLSYQEALHPKTIALGLERVRLVAQRMGLLQGVPLTLTIAGTNGKGSSATLAALTYQNAGYRVGLYTSPHLLRYAERVRINGIEASDAELCAAFAQVEAARQDISLTYFEFGTLAALLLFQQAQVDVQVLEVGLGGRLDAVNIIDADVALVTNIGLDHLDWLGPDRESIGREKAGVFRAGRPAISADPQAPQSVAACARACGAHLQQLGADFSYLAHPQGWDWKAGTQHWTNLPLPALHGMAQVRNAAGVLTVLQALQPRLPITRDAFEKALRSLFLPGRFQHQGQLILDVAHNAEAAQVLADNLRKLSLARPPLLVLGMLSDKPVEEVGSILAPVVGHTFLGGLAGPRGLTGEKLAERLQGSGLTYTIRARIETALADAQAQALPDDRIVVTGSFLTVMAALNG